MAMGAPSRFFGTGMLISLVTLLVPPGASAAPRYGSAVALRVDGKVTYVSQEGRSGLKEGTALSQGHRLEPGRDSKVDAAVTLGALIRAKEDTPVELVRLEQTSKGLALTDDFTRHIVLSQERGILMVNAGEPCKCLDLKVQTPLGDVISGGSRFIVSSAPEAWEVRVIDGEAVFARDDDKLTVKKSEKLTVRKDSRTGKVETAVEPLESDALTEEFDAFRLTTSELESKILCLPADECVCFDCFTDWIAKNRGTTPPPLEFVGDPMRWADVSPAQRR